MINIKKNEYTNAIIKKKGLYYGSLKPYCEPMLSKRGLYPTLGGHIHQQFSGNSKKRSELEYKLSSNKVIYGNELDAINWVMFFSDGNTTLFEISEKTGLPASQIFKVAKKLEKKNLLELVSEGVS